MLTKLSKYFAVVAVVVLFASFGGCSKDEGLKVTGLSPKSGPSDGGGSVTIHGTGFTKAAEMGHPQVLFGDKDARVLRFEGDGKLIVVPPPGDKGTKVDVLIIFGDGTEHKNTAAYSYIDPKEGFDVNALAPGEEE